MEAPSSEKFFDFHKVKIPYVIEIFVSENNLVIKADIYSKNSEVNFMALKYDSDHDEEIYGLGLQCTVWNFKGK